MSAEFNLVKIALFIDDKSLNGTSFKFYNVYYIYFTAININMVVIYVWQQYNLYIHTFFAG